MAVLGATAARYEIARSDLVAGIVGNNFDIVTQSILVATISVGALSIKEDKPWRFWVKVGLAVGLAVLVIYLIFWR